VVTAPPLAPEELRQSEATEDRLEPSLWLGHNQAEGVEAVETALPLPERLGVSGSR